MNFGNVATPAARLGHATGNSPILCLSKFWEKNLQLRNYMISFEKISNDPCKNIHSSIVESNNLEWIISQRKKE